MSALAGGQDGSFAWTFAARAVPPRFSGLVAEIAGFSESSAVRMFRRHPAIPFVPLIIDFGAPYVQADPADGREGPAHEAGFAAGLFDRPAATVFQGAAACIEVKLTPAGAAQLIGPQIAALANRVMPLDALFGPSMLSLRETLQRTADWRERLDHVEAFLARGFARHDGPPGDMVHAARRIAAARGRIGVRDLADALSLGRTRFTERFTAAFGLPPKRFARVARFAAAHRAIRSGMALSDAACRFGYADQAHLSREVRALAGTTPAGLRDASGDPYGGLA